VNAGCWNIINLRRKVDDVTDQVEKFPASILFQSHEGSRCAAANPNNNVVLEMPLFVVNQTVLGLIFVFVMLQGTSSLPKSNGDIHVSLSQKEIGLGFVGFEPLKFADGYITRSSRELQIFQN